MVKAYNQRWLEERAIRQQAERWHARQLLSDKQIEAIRAAYPARFKQLSAALEIGSFVFTLLAVLALYGLLSILMQATGRGAAVVSLLMAAGTFVIARLVIKSTNFYRNGIDNALWLVSALAAVWGLVLFRSQGTEVFPPFWQVCLFALPILLAYVLYTGDTILTYFLLFAGYGALFDWLTGTGWGKAALPFAVMGGSAALFVGAVGLGRQAANQVYYGDALTLVWWVALLAGLAASNFWVANELNDFLQNGSEPANRPAPLAFPGLFWLLTFALPITYLAVGMKRRSRIFLILGTAGLVGAVLTVRHYYANWPLSVSLTVDGSVLILGSICLIRFLQTPRYGFTDAPDEEASPELLLQLGTLAASQGAANAQNQPTGPRFGGGDFSGGGGGDRY